MYALMLRSVIVDADFETTTSSLDREYVVDVRQTVFCVHDGSFHVLFTTHKCVLVTVACVAILGFSVQS